MDRKTLATLFDLTDRVAIVTGGTRGIGRAIAEGYVCAGAKVVVASRKADACAETEAYLTNELGGEALGVPTHLGELDQLQAFVDATVDRFGRLDIVVNNAANALTQPLGAFTPEAWEKSFGVNLRGPVFLVQAALPLPEGEPVRRGGERAVGRRVPGVDERADVLGGEGRDARVHPRDGTRVGALRHPGERARARHRRYRHGAQQPTRSAGEHGERGADARAPRTPTRWSALLCCSCPTPGASSPAKSWLPTAAS